MDNVIYKKKNFVIIRVRNSFIVYNLDKTFEQGHTHLTSFGSAKYLINLALAKSIPYHLDKYRLTSLVRISTDPAYQEKVSQLIQNKKQKPQHYNAGRKSSMMVYTA